MSSYSTIGVDDDFSSRQTTVAMGPAYHETTSGSDMVFRRGAEPLRRQHRLYDRFHHGFFQVRSGDIWIMLCRDYDRFHSHRSVIFVTKGHLALGIRAQPWQLAGLSHLSLALHE